MTHQTQMICSSIYCYRQTLKVDYLTNQSVNAGDVCDYIMCDIFDIIPRVMSPQDLSTSVLQLPIQNYYNRKMSQPLNKRLKQFIRTEERGLAIFYADSPEDPEDFIEYAELEKITHFKKKNENTDVVAIHLRGKPKPDISFRMEDEETVKALESFVTQKIEELNKQPDYSDLLDLREKLITVIRDRDVEYRNVWRMLERDFPREKLRVLLFEKHPDMAEFIRLAKLQGYSKEKAMMLEDIKSKQDEPIEVEGSREGYDIAKTLEGIRMQDEEGKLNYQPDLEEIDDERFFGRIPEPQEQNIIEKFEEIGASKAKVERSAKTTIPEQRSRAWKEGVKLPPADKGRYSISQSSRSMIGQRGSNTLEREEAAPLNVNQAKKVALLVRCFYSLTDPKGGMRAEEKEVNCIEGQLNLLKNKESIPAYLQGSINKTLQNILQWKRNFVRRSR